MSKYEFDLSDCHNTLCLILPEGHQIPEGKDFEYEVPLAYDPREGHGYVLELEDFSTLKEEYGVHVTKELLKEADVFARAEGFRIKKLKAAIENAPE